MALCLLPKLRRCSGDAVRVHPPQWPGGILARRGLVAGIQAWGLRAGPLSRRPLGVVVSGFLQSAGCLGAWRTEGETMGLACARCRLRLLIQSLQPAIDVSPVSVYHVRSLEVLKLERVRPHAL